ncbi:putative Pentatricopeptide repeat-containing protein 2, mitochondrial [Hypsibius exemplaris]|uniref:Pentatricopeptide repeat-containing protein 2, mitochondrial n=1 Tax=Hypsibius exemplaris TaxID=2072580 RepID=A0A1W0WX04_HYPEX|nr:putative Pentatricopeptide repeat-containing protein 2, mitochondrial [Hypsibius exemplaris]
MSCSTLSRLLTLQKASPLLATIAPGCALTSSKGFAGSACRLLYTKDALGLSGYENARERTATQLGSMKDRFKVRMEQYLSADSKSLIFTEDLKNMLHLADNDADLDMVTRMMKKFVKQNEQLRFGSFVFGPVVMRLLYHLNKADEGLKLIQDPELVSFFDQLTSYHILLDLLYEKKRYSDVEKIYEILLARPFFTGRYPKECLVLIIAALHKQGTPEAYEKCKKLIQSAVAGNANVMRKAVAYAADLALKNNDAAGCLEMLTIAQNQSYVTIRNLKALALTRLDRLDDVLPIMRSVLEQDVSYGLKRVYASFFGDVISEVKEAVEKKGDKELSHEFEKIFKSLESANHLDVESKLSDFLEKEIEDVKPRLGQDVGPGGRGFGGQPSYGQQQQQGGLRQPRYADDGQQQGGSRYGSGGYSRPSYGQDGQSQQGRTDMFGTGDSDGQAQSRSGGGYQRSGGYQKRDNSSYQPRGGSYQSRGSGEDDGGELDSNAQAGYRPRSNFRRGKDGASADGGGGGYNSNAEAGYRPRANYQRNAGGSQRQGLQDLDD